MKNITIDGVEYTPVVKEDGKREHWVPENGDDYLFTDNFGNIKSTSTIKKTVQKDYTILVGQYSRTKEEEEKKNAVRKSIQKILIYIGKNFGIWEPTKGEWRDNNPTKFYIVYDYTDNMLDYQLNSLYKYYSPIGYLKTEEDCGQLIRDCKEDLELIFK